MVTTLSLFCFLFVIVYLIIGKLNIYNRSSVVRSLLAVRSVEHIFTDGLVPDEDVMLTGTILEEHFIGLTVHLLGGGEEAVRVSVLLVVDLLHLGPELQTGLVQLAALTEREEREEREE